MNSTVALSSKKQQILLHVARFPYEAWRHRYARLCRHIHWMYRIEWVDKDRFQLPQRLLRPSSAMYDHIVDRTGTVLYGVVVQVDTVGTVAAAPMGANSLKFPQRSAPRLASLPQMHLMTRQHGLPELGL
jgi:hypothetical protein